MFHWRDGWFFQRTEDGGVHIEKRESAIDGAPTIAEGDIPENEWASIVASVSRDGETGERWMEIRRFHGSIPSDE